MPCEQLECVLDLIRQNVLQYFNSNTMALLRFQAISHRDLRYDPIIRLFSNVHRNLFSIALQYGFHKLNNSMNVFYKNVITSDDHLLLLFFVTLFCYRGIFSFCVWSIERFKIGFKVIHSQRRMILICRWSCFNFL